MDSVKASGYVFDSMGKKESLERQKQIIQEYCKENDYELVSVYENTKERTDLQDKDRLESLIGECVRIGAKTFITSDLSRISKDYGEYTDIVDAFKSKGIEVISTNPDKEYERDVALFYTRKSVGR